MTGKRKGKEEQERKAVTGKRKCTCNPKRKQVDKTREQTIHKTEKKNLIMHLMSKVFG